MMNHHAWCILILIALLGRCTISETIDQQPINKSTIQSIDQSTAQQINQSSNESINQPFASSSSSPVYYFGYSQTSTFSMPNLPYGYAQIVASRDPSQPDRLFYIEDRPTTSIYSIDMRTGQPNQTINLTNECGFNVTRIYWVAPLSDSIMVYTVANQTINQSSQAGVVIVRYNHTTGECMRAWPVNVTSESLYYQQFAVDEANQQFALLTSSWNPSSSTAVLSLFSMITGNVIASNIVCNSVLVGFDPFSGDYLAGPAWCGDHSQWGQFQQLSGENLLLIRTFMPDSPYSVNVVFFDQVGSMIVGSTPPSYVFPNNVWNQFVTTINGVWVWVKITPLLNHDVIILFATNPGYAAVRFSQYPLFPGSSSSSTPAAVSSSSSSSAPWIPSSSSTPAGQYWDYTQSSTFAMPQPSTQYEYYSQVIASRDPSQPDRLFYLSQQPIAITSVDTTTGKSLPAIILTTKSLCGFNVTQAYWLQPLSDSIMVYTVASQSGAVIMRLNHTSGDCMRAWQVTVTHANPVDQQFAVDETNQRFALFTSILPGSHLAVLSMFSMATGNVIATNSSYYLMRLSFDPYSGTYLLGPNVWTAGVYGEYNQVSGADLSFDRKFLPDPNGAIFFDQVGSLIVLTTNVTVFGYQYPNGVWHQFPALGAWWVSVTPALNHDVIAIYVNGSGYSGIRYKQYHASQLSSSSSTASFSSSSAPVIPYWDYTQSATINMPQPFRLYTQIAASRDPSQPDRLFYITQEPRYLYSVDLTTGQYLPPWDSLTYPCGFNTTWIYWIVPLSNSIMLYTTTNQSDAVVILHLNHTSGECLRAWPFTVTNFRLYTQGFAVDEANQRFVLFTASPNSDTGTLSMISMATGAVLAANSNYYIDFLSFDPYSGDYLCGPNLRMTGQRGSYNQISGDDLSLVRTFQPYSNSWFRTIFYDQTGSRIALGDSFAYITPTGALNPFSSNVAGVPIQITSALNHDVIAVCQNDGYTGYTAARFKQYRPSPVSSSSSASVSSTASLSSGESSAASGTSSSTGESSSTGLAERSSEWSTGKIAAFVVGLICLVGLGVLIGLSISYCKLRLAESKARSQSLGDVLLTSA